VNSSAPTGYRDFFHSELWTAPTISIVLGDLIYNLDLL